MPQDPARPRARPKKAKREAELKAAQEALAAAAEAQRKLEREINELKADRAKLNAALIDGTRRMRATEERVAALEQRVDTASGSEAAIRRSLEARRSLVVEVLAALQRMGRRPPPAVLVRPEDILAAVRTSMLLGAVLPELRSETEALAADLSELVRLRAALAADRRSLEQELADLSREQERTAALVAARQSRLAEAERSFGAERAKSAELAREAQTLKELIERMERDVAAAQKASEEARKAAEAQARETRERFAAAAFRDPARLAPKIPFPEARGLLPMPVAGAMVREFGGPDGVGGTTPRHLNFDTTPCCRRLARRWLGRLRGAVPVVWAIVDHQCGGRLLSSSSRHGSNQGRGGPIRACRGAGGDDGRHFVLVGGQRGRRNRRPGALCRVP